MTRFYLTTPRIGFQNDTQRDATIDFMKQGKGVAGIHAASDNFYKWKPGARMVVSSMVIRWTVAAHGLSNLMIPSMS